MDNMFTSRDQKWEQWETKLVLYSLLAGIVGLIVLGLVL